MNPIELGRGIAKRDITKCIICQKDQPKVNLSSSRDGRRTIVECIEKLGDNFLYGLTAAEKDEIKYHSRSCYSSYKLKAERTPSKSQLENNNDIVNDSETLLNSPGPSTRTTRPRESSPITRTLLNQSFSCVTEKPCIICEQFKYKNDTKRYRVCETNRAKNFIKAYNFNKDKVYDKCILYKTPGDIFAADIVAHKKCMKKYIKNYLDNVEELLKTFDDVEKEEAKAFEVQLAIDELCLNLDLETKGYEISVCRGVVNTKLAETGI